MVGYWQAQQGIVWHDLGIIINHASGHQWGGGWGRRHPSLEAVICFGDKGKCSIVVYYVTWSGSVQEVWGDSDRKAKSSVRRLGRSLSSSKKVVMQWSSATWAHVQCACGAVQWVEWTHPLCAVLGSTKSRLSDFPLLLGDGETHRFGIVTSAPHNEHAHNLTQQHHLDLLHCLFHCK